MLRTFAFTLLLFPVFVLGQDGSIPPETPVSSLPAPADDSAPAPATSSPAHPGTGSAPAPLSAQPVRNTEPPVQAVSSEEPVALSAASHEEADTASSLQNFWWAIGAFLLGVLGYGAYRASGGGEKSDPCAPLKARLEEIRNERGGLAAELLAQEKILAALQEMIKEKVIDTAAESVLTEKMLAGKELYDETAEAYEKAEAALEYLKTREIKLAEEEKRLHSAHEACKRQPSSATVSLPIQFPDAPAKVYLIHGCPSHEENPNTRTYDKHWMPWTKKELAKHGIQAETPLMPSPWEPSYEKFKEAFEKLGVHEQDVLVGHSCGASFLVRWLGDRKQKIAKLILVAPWKVAEEDEPYRKAFYDYAIDKTISERVGKVIIFTADDEEKAGKESAKLFHETLGGELLELKKHGHYTFEDMKTEKFPELVHEILRHDKR